MDRVRNMLGCNLPEVISYTGKGVYAAILDSGERVIIMSS